MNYLKRSVTLGLDGLLHKSKLVNTSNQLNIDGRAITLPISAVSADIIVDANGIVFCIVNNWEETQVVDSCFLFIIALDDSFTYMKIADNGGASHAALRFNGSAIEIYNQRKDQTGIDVYDSSGFVIRTLPTPYASEGIHHIEPDGTPIMGNDQSLFGYIYGIRVWNIFRANGYSGGQIETPSDGVLLTHPSGYMEWVQAYTNVPQKIAVNGNTTWVAISGQYDFEPDSIPWTPYPYVVTPDPSYNPKDDLIAIRADLDKVIAKL